MGHAWVSMVSAAILAAALFSLAVVPQFRRPHRMRPTNSGPAGEADSANCGRPSGLLRHVD